MMNKLINMSKMCVKDMIITWMNDYIHIVVKLSNMNVLNS